MLLLYHLHVYQQENRHCHTPRHGHAMDESIPGWKEDVEPVRHRSLFWHNIWMECGKLHTGPIADIMRKTKSAYHYAIRKAKRAVNDKINQRFADAILENKSRDFWDEVKRIH